MGTPSPNGQAPPLAPEGLADAPTSLPAHSPFFALGWHSMHRAERDAAANELARAEEGFLIAAHAFGRSLLTSWLEAVALMSLAAVYRREGSTQPDWLGDRITALRLEPEAVKHLFDIFLLIEITPPDSPHLQHLLEDLRAYRAMVGTRPALRSDDEAFYSACAGLGPTGRLTIGRRAMRAGDFDVAELAFSRAATEYRQQHQPIPEVFALVELAAMYQQLSRFDRLPALIRRVRRVLNRSSLTSDQFAVVQLAVELIESGHEDPESLEIFCACWDCGEGSDS